jgi:acid phosphatase (class A)
MLALIIAIGAIVPASTQDRPSGYLVTGEFDVMKVLKPAPKPGEPQYETDRSTFLATRKLEGTPRWKLATTDAENAAASMLRDYSCAVGATLTPQNSPKLLNVVSRAGIDTGTQTNLAKDVFARKRPFEIDQGAVCQPTSQLFDKAHQRMSYDYPSGHATWGWTWALVLSAIAPDRAQQIQQRGRAYGDSRVICGAHNASSIEAGMKSATATMAVVSTKPAYKEDMAAARAELAALRASGPAPQACEVEGALIAQRGGLK